MYINLLKLVNEAVKHDILKTHKGQVLVFRNKGINNKAGWQPISKEDLAKELMRDNIGIRYIMSALEQKGLKFERVYDLDKESLNTNVFEKLHSN
jgi:hypothetical protein